MDSLKNECSYCAELRRLADDHEHMVHPSDNPGRRREEPLQTVKREQQSESVESTDGRTLKDIERAHVERMLRETGGNLSKAAKILAIDRGTLYSKMRRYGLK